MNENIQHPLIVPQSETLGELRVRVAHLYVKLRQTLSDASARLRNTLDPVVAKEALVRSKSSETRSEGFFIFISYMK